MIEIVPELINLFLAGFIFMILYNRLSNKTMELHMTVLWGLLINQIIRSFYTVLHSFVWPETRFEEAFKVMVYVLTALILPFVIAKVRNSIFCRKIISKCFKKTPNLYAIDDVIDQNSATTMAVYLKDSDICYVGTYRLKDEVKTDYYIVLISYGICDKKTLDVVRDLSEVNSCVMINIKDIERIEFIYKEDSKVWAWLNGEK